ncbi:MAG TPA: hypothetical protein VGK73_12795 [Polyangiaceae bacterium]
MVLALGAACSASGTVTPGIGSNANGGTGNTGTGGTIATGGRGGGVGVSGSGGTIMVEPGKGGTPGNNPPARLCEICNDFPADPIIVEGTPATAPTQFGTPGSAAGPCVAEPADGTLFPHNWLRPRIRWTGNSQVYEVRVHTARQANDLVVYTNKTEYYIPREIWSGVAGGSQGLARNNYEEDIVVTVRGPNTAGTSVTFRTAAVDAGGSMVYWASVKTQTSESPADGDAAGWLMGFSVGDESVVEALRVLDVDAQIRSYAAEPKRGACIGCHTSTPDGEAVSFTTFWPWSGSIAGITPENRGQIPSFVTPSGLTAIQQMWMGAWTYSPGQWTETRKIAIASYGANDIGWPDGDMNKTNRDNLLWMNIATTTPATVPTQAWEVKQNWTPMARGVALGILPRTVDTRAALMPDFSNSGSTIAYTSSSNSLDGRIGEINDTDIYTVPFNEGNGGPATALAGAAQQGTAEYYPNYSADDGFVAFNRIANVESIRNPSGQGFANHLYYRPESDIWVVAPGGSASAGPNETSEGGAIRLKANDADSCNTLVASRRGALNSWAKFSPRVETIAGKTYYFLIFSSTRDTPESQRVTVSDPQYAPNETLYSRLFMAAFTVEGGVVTTHPAVYLWNQDETSNNLTPAWDEFKIPDVPLPADPR